MPARHADDMCCLHRHTEVHGNKTHDCWMLTGVLGRDLGVLTDIVLARGDVPLLNLGVRLPLLLAFRLLTCLKTLQQVSNMRC